MTDPSHEEVAALASSPLAQADAASLDELFSRQPTEWTQPDLKVMVEAFRRQRLLWNAGEKAPKPKKSSANPAVSAQIALNDLDLGGLGL